MRLLMRLPAVDPTAISAPQTCPHGCGGRHFKLRQVVAKLLRDTKVRRSKRTATAASGAGAPSASIQWG